MDSVAGVGVLQKEVFFSFPQSTSDRSVRSEALYRLCNVLSKHLHHVLSYCDAVLMGEWRKVAVNTSG